MTIDSHLKRSRTEGTRPSFHRRIYGSKRNRWAGVRFVALFSSSFVGGFFDAIDEGHFFASMKRSDLRDAIVESIPRGVTADFPGLQIVACVLGAHSRRKSTRFVSTGVRESGSLTTREGLGDVQSIRDGEMSELTTFPFSHIVPRQKSWRTTCRKFVHFPVGHRHRISAIVTHPIAKDFDPDRPQNSPSPAF